MVSCTDPPSDLAGGGGKRPLLFLEENTYFMGWDVIEMEEEKTQNCQSRIDDRPESSRGEESPSSLGQGAT